MTIQERLRGNVQKLRTKFVPLCDMIPLMQEAADDIDNLNNEINRLQAEITQKDDDESDMLMIAYMHGASSMRNK